MMSFIQFILALLLIPSCLGRVLSSNSIQELGSGKSRTNVKTEKNRLLLPSLNIRNAPPEVIKLSPGENAVLECEAGGNPPPTIHWLKDGKKISQSTYDVLHSTTSDMMDVEPVLGLSFTRSRLFVDCMTFTDHGSYTCVAENTYTRKSKTTQIYVNEPLEEENNAMCLIKKSFGSPARINMWTHTRLEVTGNDVQLFCRSEGQPQPQVTWYGPNDESLVEGRKYQVMENGDLIIRSIEWSDMGGYTCEAQNDEGIDQTLTFLYPTMPEKGELSKG